MKENNNKLNLSFREVQSVSQAIQALLPLEEMVQANAMQG
jgi:hypothetical protein